jgi:hypothetical protein
VALVAGIAVAAIVHVVRTGGGDTAAPPTTAAETSTTTTPTDEEPEQLPAIVPLAGELREEGGVLWWSDERCQAKALDLASGGVVSLPGEHCRIWPSPGGNRVVATAASRSDALDGRGLVLFGYPAAEGERMLGEGTVIQHSPGVIASELVWAADERTVHVCVATRDGIVTDVVDADGGGVAALPDQCFPAMLDDGRLATVLGPLTVAVDGEPLLGRGDARALLPSVPRRAERVVSALGAGGDELVAGLAAVVKGRLLPTSAALAVVTRDGDIRFSAFLPEDVLPATAGLSPRGDALWYFDAGDGSAHVIQVPGGRELPPYGSRWVAWSPDGDYVALARGRSIVILRWPDGTEVERIPVAGNVVYWTRAPGQ